MCDRHTEARCHAPLLPDCPVWCMVFFCRSRHGTRCATGCPAARPPRRRAASVTAQVGGRKAGPCLQHRPRGCQQNVAVFRPALPRADAVRFSSVRWRSATQFQQCRGLIDQLGICAKRVRVGRERACALQPLWITASQLRRLHPITGSVPPGDGGGGKGHQVCDERSHCVGAHTDIPACSKDRGAVTGGRGLMLGAGAYRGMEPPSRSWPPAGAFGSPACQVARGMVGLWGLHVPGVSVGGESARRERRYDWRRGGWRRGSIRAGCDGAGDVVAGGWRRL